ncbi:uncharacterized protein ACHE_11902S [Aspergillus chevalieri]|uniref:Major facilitator superfamily (MFS) profile domain-containing protein n=1 Tax=Aspergillus chevalieri TaxID=182096 RepID=A0A7R7ZJC0_ASPCH|nr:uncharacterized protein ACHE_11902S [Aspergillus chevalieri]BCR84500.1 hypothetical protein ACHE_11902S [Aspergillus chevalieri]
MSKADDNVSRVSDPEKEVQPGNEPEESKLDRFEDPDEGVSEEERAKRDRKLLWKLDLRLVPWLCLLYLVAFLDRTNIGNAKVAGLQEDLNITDTQYNIALTVFFISYSVFEPLTNVLLKRWGPSIFIPVIVILWVSTPC